MFSAMEKRRRRLLETGQQGKRKNWGSKKIFKWKDKVWVSILSSLDSFSPTDLL